MSEKTNIQWCDDTFNPWWGCTQVSEGCRFCYAETIANWSDWISISPCIEALDWLVKLPPDADAWKLCEAEWRRWAASHIAAKHLPAMMADADADVRECVLGRMAKVSRA